MNFENEVLLNYSNMLEKFQKIDKEKIILYHKKSLLLQGDVLNENNFDEETFDLIITSPPYK
jgi:DNA modification methylase